MSFIGKIVNTGIDRLIKSTGEVLDNLTTTQDEKNKAELAKQRLQYQATRLAQEMADRIEERVQRDMENLREMVKVELRSEDAYVRRARPSIIWLGLAIIVLNYGLIPLLQFITGQQFFTVDLPTEFWFVFGTYSSGYAYLRTREKSGNKINLKDKF